jgi:pSer/pThr/pTyr-binding forkhead associated (FHA) protein
VKDIGVKDSTSKNADVNNPSSSGTDQTVTIGATEVLASPLPASATPAEPRNQKAALRILLPTGDVFDREVSSAEVQLGKGPRNDIVIADPAVSTAHAALKTDGQKYSVADLGSRNGTFVNGERIIEPRELHHGDIVGIGLSKITFRLIGYSETGAISASDVPPGPGGTAPPPLTNESLKAALIASGLVSSDEVERFGGSGSAMRRLARPLVENGIVAETAMADLICRTFQLPRVDLRTTAIDEDVAIGFSSKIAREHLIFAFGKQSGVLLLAMADPTDTAAVSMVEREFKTTSAVHVSTFGDINEQIEKYYGPKLIGVLPSGEKLRFLISQGEVEIGKASHNHIVLNDPTVSNAHAVLMVRDGGYTIVDLGSRNGTFVNGDRLGGQPRTLRHGDTIQLGQTVLTFRNSGETPENVTATLSPTALAEVRRRAEAMASSEMGGAGSPASLAPGGVTDGAESEEAKKKKKKKGKDDRMKAAYIGGLSRIIAQIVSVVLAVGLALYLSTGRQGQQTTVIETTTKGKAKIKVAKIGEGFAFNGGFFEASGVAQIPGTDGVYFVSDSKPGQIFFMPLNEQGQQAGDIQQIDLGVQVHNPEAMAYTGSVFYVVGSQADKQLPEMNSLLRFDIDPATQTIKGKVEVVADLQGFLFNNVPELGPYRSVQGQSGGLNVEGIAWDAPNERLLLGLRSPVIGGKAIVVPLKMRDTRAALTAENLMAGTAILIGLGGSGIRDITYDNRVRVFLILSGSPLHGDTSQFALWEWPGDPAPSSSDEFHELHKFADGKWKPEGLCRVRIANHEFLFIVGDASRYMAVELATE